MKRTTTRMMTMTNLDLKMKKRRRCHCQGLSAYLVMQRGATIAILVFKFVFSKFCQNFNGSCPCESLAALHKKVSRHCVLQDSGGRPSLHGRLLGRLHRCARSHLAVPHGCVGPCTVAICTADNSPHSIQSNSGTVILATPEHPSTMLTPLQFLPIRPV